MLYVSDLDRAGVTMPVSVSRHAQFWAGELKIDAELTVERLALTTEQVERYQLPKAPDTDATELDALEALHPGVLADLVREAVAPWRDDDLAGRLAEADADAEVQASDQLTAAVADLAADAGHLRAEADEIMRPIIEQLRPIIERGNAALADVRRRAEELNDQLQQRIDEVEFDLPDRPEPAEPGVDTTGMLYDSRRHWLDQLAAYQAARN